MSSESMSGPRKRVYDWPDKVLFFQGVLAGQSMRRALAPIGQAQLSGVRDEVRPPVIFVGQAAVVIAGVVLVSSFASGPLAVWERARTSMPR
ncbi:hypothetical protein Namu_3747 [Nakamurella multipartita DSM 44233]|uniref:Uncharacterized protein n=1 Tax=Nakamurella multipartita (strain ATCC 700099 / DSM 44233 / CIP 104796 / JCM 9543 / NBRC 105858 / Y-104) TaxID=479431 RepID=C8XG43_NAKMY|nr:hypothetical protein Namu_3747 [Nakamurella multipartita DSM 44233]